MTCAFLSDSRANYVRWTNITTPAGGPTSFHVYIERPDNVEVQGNLFRFDSEGKRTTVGRMAGGLVRPSLYLQHVLVHLCTVRQRLIRRRCALSSIPRLGISCKLLFLAKLARLRYVHSCPCSGALHLLLCGRCQRLVRLAITCLPWSRLRPVRFVTASLRNHE